MKTETKFYIKRYQHKSKERLIIRKKQKEIETLLYYK